MPKFHKKQSKRVSCRKKYKIVKKVAEHNRKLRREEKKNPSKRKLKDPGVPNSLPFKEEILHEAEKRKQRAKDLKEAQKQQRFKQQQEKRGLTDLVKDARKREREFQNSSNHIITKETKKEVSIPFKSYYKELKKVVEEADVILEVLDSRDPLGSRCPQLEQMVINSRKKLVLVLNKIDLIPRANLDDWLKYLRKELPAVAFKASTQTQNTNLSQSKVAAIHINESLQSSKRCVGASFLMKVLGNYSRNQDIQTSIKVGVVGFPNVGKSSVINSLKRSRSCTVGATPGVTKSVQEVVLHKHIKILDSPGVVFAKDGSPTTLALRNVVKVETLSDVITPAEAIIQRADKTQLCLHYTVPEFSSAQELLCMLAKRMGMYKKGGIPNAECSARKLINDWNRGKIKYYTHPPEEYKLSVHLSAEFVEEMGKAFDISSLEENMELDKIPEVFPSEGVAAKYEEPTEGMTSENEEEAMEADGAVESQDNKVTVSMESKKSGKDGKGEETVDLTRYQKNKLSKNAFKRMKRKRKKHEKRVAALADSIDQGFSLE